MTKINRDPKAVALAESIIDTYKPKSVADMQVALKDIFGPMFEGILKGEIDYHLGYDEHDHGQKDTDNRRNGYSSKGLKTSAGERFKISRCSTIPISLLSKCSLCCNIFFNAILSLIIICSITLFS